MQKQGPSSGNCSPLITIQATQSSEDCQVLPASCLLVLAGDSSIHCPPIVYVSTHLSSCWPSQLTRDIQGHLSSPGYSFHGSPEISVPKSPSQLGLAQFLDALLHKPTPAGLFGIFHRYLAQGRNKTCICSGIWKSVSGPSTRLGCVFSQMYC